MPSNRPITDRLVKAIRAAGYKPGDGMDGLCYHDYSGTVSMPEFDYDVHDPDGRRGWTEAVDPPPLDDLDAANALALAVMGAMGDIGGQVNVVDDGRFVASMWDPAKMRIYGSIQPTFPDAVASLLERMAEHNNNRATAQGA